MAIDKKDFDLMQQGQMTDVLKKELHMLTAFQSSLGSRLTPIGDNFFGLNHRMMPGRLPMNKDVQGLTFFTRPDLNFSTDNLVSLRKFNPLLTENANSLQRIIRCYLDPDLQSGQGRFYLGSNPNAGAGRTEPIITTTLVDQNQAFIPILTNTLISLSGWPDLEVPTYTSKAGFYGEEMFFADGIFDYNRKFSLTANFRNIAGDPINALFYYWCAYQSAVFEGTLVPKMDNLAAFRIDYNTRIYQLIMDQSKTQVRGIAACGAAMPTVSPLGAKFNYDRDKPYNMASDEISMSFECVGAMYMDEILIREFNNTTVMFNPSMNGSKIESTMTKIPITALGLFNNKGYPRINESTYELEWWVFKEDYVVLKPYMDVDEGDIPAPEFEEGD